MAELETHLDSRRLPESFVVLPRPRSSVDASLGPLAIALGIAAQVAVLRHPEGSTGTWLYAAAILVVAAAALTDRGEGSPPWRHGALVTLLLVALAAALRLTLLTQHPGIFGDEGEQGLDARRILHGARPPLAGYGWWGVPNVHFYVAAIFMKIAGDDIFGLRLLSVASGVVAVLYVTRTGRLLFSDRAGIVAGTLLAVSPVALQFSRFASCSSPTGALWAVGFFHVARALTEGKKRDAVTGGVAFGASLYFYASAKLLFALLPLLAVLVVLMRPRRGAFFLTLLVIASFGVTFSPLGITSWKDRQAFAGRFDQTVIFSPGNRPLVFAAAGVPYRAEWNEESAGRSLVRHPGGWARVLLNQLVRTVHAFYRNGEPTVFYRPGVHNGSLLSPLVAPLAFLGLAWGLARIRDFRYALLVLWFWGGLAGAILTADTPSVQRMAGAWPALMLFPGIVLDRTAARLESRGPTRMPGVLMSLLLAAIAVHDVREYFVIYRATAPFGDATAQARFAAALSRDYRFYQLGIGIPPHPDLYFGYGSTQFHAKDAEGEDIGSVSDRFPIVDEKGKGLAFLVYPSNAVFLPVLQLLYPEGQARLVEDDRHPYFTSYVVPLDAVKRQRRVRARYSLPSGKTIERDEAAIGTLGQTGTPGEWLPPPGLVYPARASWEAAFVWRGAEVVDVTLAGAREGDAELSVDGRVVLREAGREAERPVRLRLARGLHELRFSDTLRDGPTPLGPVFCGQPLARRLLFPTALGGLFGEVWQGGADLDAIPKRPAESWRVDPFLAIRDGRVDRALPSEPFLVRWRGTLRVTKGGLHVFWLRGNGASRLILDGRAVLATPARSETTIAVDLEPGPHPLEVRWSWGPERSYIELSWAPPGGPPGLIPPQALSPEKRSEVLRADAGPPRRAGGRSVREAPARSPGS
jgi:4-amino-4-deoxy-L-arabinose transferase-like glycosyltransferase